MTGRPRESKKDRLRDFSDIGEVVFPIEKLMAARTASFSCVDIEAVLESEHDATSPVKDRSHSAVTGKKKPK